MNKFDPNKITFFAKTDARGQNIPFGIKAIDRTKHMYVIGKTGMGKSTLLENMAVQDIRSGEGIAFIDPHGATAETLLDYIPDERKDDVLYFAPFDMEHPVSFNVMEDVGADRRHLVVSGLMSVFEKIWVDAWSARMAYILQNTLMALLEYPDSTLLGVNRVLSDKNYRKRVVDNISDPSVKSFWVDEFAKYNERYMQEAGDAIKNKIGQFTANPLIRNIIGQPKSSFDLRKIMDEQKIVIMNLSKGLVGESNANLLGSMLTTRIYLAAMSRADLNRAQMNEMPNFYFYVDEFQSFANATFADILSEARKYKLNLTIAHQYIEQMEEEVRNAVFGNVGTIAAFRVGPFDAEVLETIFAPQFMAIDICNLGFAQIYLTLMIDGVGSQPFSAVTLPPLEKPTVSCTDIIVHSSRNNYSRPRAEVEAEILAWHQQQHESEHKGGGQSNGSGSGGKNYGSGGGNRQSSGSEQRRAGQGSGGSNGSGGNGGGRSVQREQSSRPEREERRDGGDKRERPRENRPRNNTNTQSSSKSLDELRAVLAGITKKDEEKKNVEKPNDDEKSRVHTDVEKKNINRDEQKNNVKPLADANHLKGALAEVLKKQGINGEQKKVEEQDQGTKKVESTTLPQSHAQQTEPVQKPAIMERPTSDPLDPKALERMMRSRSDDKTPMK